MRHAEGRQNGNVDNDRHKCEEGRDEIGHGWIHEDKGREGPSCGAGDNGEAERNGGGEATGGDGSELAQLVLTAAIPRRAGRHLRCGGESVLTSSPSPPFYPRSNSDGLSRKPAQAGAQQREYLLNLVIVQRHGNASYQSFFTGHSQTRACFALWRILPVRRLPVGETVLVAGKYKKSTSGDCGLFVLWESWR